MKGLRGGLRVGAFAADQTLHRLVNKIREWAESDAVDVGLRLMGDPSHSGPSMATRELIPMSGSENDLGKVTCISGLLTPG